MERRIISAEYYNRLRGQNVFISVWAVVPQAAPGLAIHHMLGRYDIPTSRRRITHIATGRLVGKVDGYHTLGQAINAAESLAVWVDWTSAAVVLNEHTDANECKHIAITG